MRKLSSTNTINKSYLEEVCGMAYTVSVIGGRWKLSILGILLDHGKHRYNQLQKRLPGISERMLAKQLKELEKEELIVKHTFAEVPPRVEYDLSEKGRSLKPVLEAMTTWGNFQTGIARSLDAVSLKPNNA